MMNVKHTALENTMKKSTLLYSVSAVLFAIFVAFTVIVAFCGKATVIYDEAAGISAEIGLAGLNQSVFNALGTSDLWYEFTEFAGIIALVCAGIFALIGLGQLAKRKSVWAVDREILLLALLYALVAIFYVLFEIIVINYRPILIDGVLEASYPSSHTMLACVVFVSTPFACRHLIKSDNTHSTVTLLCYFLAIVTVIGRLMSGVHWLTDIIGSVLLSAALVLLYVATVTLLNEKNPRKKRHSRR